MLVADCSTGMSTSEIVPLDSALIMIAPVCCSRGNERFAMLAPPAARIISEPVQEVRLGKSKESGMGYAQRIKRLLTDAQLRELEVELVNVIFPQGIAPEHLQQVK